MLSEGFRKLSTKEQERLGLPDGYKIATPFPFDGMNQSDSRIGMPDKDLFYIENFIRLGDGNYRTLWDAGDYFFPAPNGLSIVSFFFYNVGPANVYGGNNYAIVFFNDGTAVQVNDIGPIAVTSTTNTFYDSSVSTQLPCCSQWGSQYLLIANNITPNSYWVWDGSILYTAGTLSPQVTVTNSGSGYTSAPTVTAYGGSGSGATFTATVSSGSVVSIAITAPGSGYEPDDQVQLYITGGGSDSGVELTASLAAGAVTSVIVTDPGSGYTAGTYALGFSGGGGTGAAGTYTVDSTQTVISTAITAGGSGYTGSPTISFPSGGGSSAAGFATITAGKVSSVTVVHGGTNLTGTPTISFVGGGGTGATAVAHLTSGAIASVTVTAGGTGYTSAPAVVVSTGLNQAAAATVSLMPYGISGSSMETFEDRVWIGYPFQIGATSTSGTFNVSAPGSFSNFATSAGGLNFVSTDSFLRAQYTNFKQSNGYLYPFGDSSVSVISNVQTTFNSNTGASSTTLNYQNTDPQIGTSWRDSCTAFSRTVLFGNPLGIYGLYGGAVTKTSGKIDQIFTNSIIPPTVGALTPSSAVANIYSKKVFIQLMTFQDPFTQAPVNKMVCWDEKDWFIASQSVNLIYIGTQEVNSSITAYGTDGAFLYPLFNKPSTKLTKKISTKLYGVNDTVIMKRAYDFIFQGQDNSTNSAGISLNVNVDTNFTNPNTQANSYPVPNPVTFQAAIPTYPLYTADSGDIAAMNLGLTITSTSPDFSVNFIGIGTINDHAELALPGG